MEFICYWYNGEKKTVNEEWLEGVDNIKDIKELKFYLTNGEKLQVTYKNGNILHYENVHGTWGFPCKII